MRILIVTEYYPESINAPMKGGVESRSFYVTQNLSKANEVSVICSYQKDQKRFDTVGNVKVYRVGKIHPYTNKGSIFTRLNFASSAYKKGKSLKENFDVVEGYNFISYLPAYYIGKYKKAKKIATYHEVWVGEWVKNKGLITGTFGSIWERRVLSLKWDKIISVSEFTKKKLEKFYDKEKIVVVPNGIELQKYNNIQSNNNKFPTISCVARLIPQKKVDDLIKAIALLKKEYPNIKCKIVGSGDEMKNLKAITKKLSLEDNIEFLGFIEKHEDVLSIIKSSDVFVLPSILEGFGIAVIEAMALNVPYVATRIPPIVEVTNNGVGGLLFEPENVKELAKNIKKLLNDKELLDKKRKESKEFVKRYDWEIIIQKLKEIYR